MNITKQCTSIADLSATIYHHLCVLATEDIDGCKTHHGAKQSFLVRLLGNRKDIVASGL